MYTAPYARVSKRFSIIGNNKNVKIITMYKESIRKQKIHEKAEEKIDGYITSCMYAYYEH